MGYCCQWAALYWRRRVSIAWKNANSKDISPVLTQEFFFVTFDFLLHHKLQLNWLRHIAAPR